MGLGIPNNVPAGITAADGKIGSRKEYAILNTACSKAKHEAESMAPSENREYLIKGFTKAQQELKSGHISAGSVAFLKNQFEDDPSKKALMEDLAKATTAGMDVDPNAGKHTAAMEKHVSTLGLVGILNDEKKAAGAEHKAVAKAATPAKQDAAKTGHKEIDLGTTDLFHKPEYQEMLSARNALSKGYEASVKIGTIPGRSTYSPKVTDITYIRYEGKIQIGATVTMRADGPIEVLKQKDALENQGFVLLDTKGTLTREKSGKWIMSAPAILPETEQSGVWTDVLARSGIEKDHATAQTKQSPKSAAAQCLAGQTVTVKTGGIFGFNTTKTPVAIKDITSATMVGTGIRAGGEPVIAAVVSFETNSLQLLYDAKSALKDMGVNFPEGDSETHIRLANGNWQYSARADITNTEVGRKFAPIVAEADVVQTNTASANPKSAIR